MLYQSVASGNFCNRIQGCGAMAHFRTIHDRRLRSVELLGLVILTGISRSPGQTVAELQTQTGEPETYLVGLLQKLKQQGWIECQDGIWTLRKRGLLTSSVHPVNRSFDDGSYERGVSVSSS
jgi:hypothetical protein